MGGMLRVPKKNVSPRLHDIKKGPREEVPDTEEATEQEAEIKEEEVVEMEQRLAARDLSLDTPADAEEESPLLDFIPDKKATVEEEVAATQYRQLVAEKMAKFAERLKGREQVIFEKRLLAEEPLTLQEIGDQYGISRERVRQLEERLKRKLKDYLLKEFKDLKDLDVGSINSR